MPSSSAIGDDREALLRQACEELQSRLRAGEVCHVETLLSAYPTLASEPQAALDLILTEWAVRRELGHEPDLEELVRRFPQWEFDLRRQFDALAHSTGSAVLVDAIATLPQSSAESSVTLDGPIPALGGHELFEEVGRGHMGIVFRARDKVLDRIVALKRIRAGVLAEAREIRRFYIEARAAAQLKHPNIVPIYGMGHFQGEHCFTMEWVPGGSLADHLDRYTSDARAAVALMAKAARAIHAAHEKMIIHRDLKPANILLTAQGDPLVSDFGLAKLPDTSADLTIPGQLMGTPAYMSPEQAAGEAWNVTPATDVWALGAILYELSSGKRPFLGRDAKQVLRRVLEANPPLPRSVNPSVDKPLERIILGCLRRNPAERYPSAEAFADDLEHWLRKEEVHPPRPAVSGSPSVKARRPRFGILAVLAFALVACAIVTSAWLIKPSLWNNSADPPNPIEFLDDNGFTKGGEWVYGGGKIQARGGRTVELESMGRELALLQLAPSVPWERYRLRAQVQIVGDTGYAGIYTAFYHHAGERGSETGFVEIEFSEQNLVEIPDIHRKQAQGSGTLRRAVMGLDKGKPGLHISERPLTPPKHFDGASETWRTLAMEVTPESIGFAIYWDDDSRPWSTVPVYPTLEDAQSFLVEKVPFPHRESPALDLRGGVGLVCEKGKARFRDVVLEPLPEKKP
jgi:serine/threonine protein kinase